MPDGNEADIVPMSQKEGPPLATYIPKAEGLIRRFAEAKVLHQEIPCRTFRIFKNDTFEYDPLSSDPPNYRQAITMGEEPGPRIGYLVAMRVPSGEMVYEFCPGDYLDKCKQASPMGRKDAGPWKKWPEMMERKSAVRWAFKNLPKPTALSVMLARDYQEGGVDFLPEGDAMAGEIGPGSAEPTGSEALDQFEAGA